MTCSRTCRWHWRRHDRHFPRPSCVGRGVRRRAPRWSVEATAWAAALVLVGGGLAVWSMRDAGPAQQAQAETPVVTSVPEVTTPSPVPTRTFVPAAPAAA